MTISEHAKMKNNPIVLSLCDYTGNMVEPWLEAGHECWIVDVQHEPGVHRDGNLVRVGADATEWLPPRRDYTICFAFPPCTHLAVSGARWFRKKGLSALSEAIDVFGACVNIAEWTDAPYMIENPVSTISTYYRKPDYNFDPCDYGDPYTKKTCLWIGSGFRMPWKAPVEPTEGSKMHLLPPGPERANKRSETPMGFAKAVYEANWCPEGSSFVGNRCRSGKGE
jgi:hypothetical protein